MTAVPRSWHCSLMMETTTLRSPWSPHWLAGSALRRQRHLGGSAGLLVNHLPRRIVGILPELSGLLFGILRITDSSRTIACCFTEEATSGARCGRANCLCSNLVRHGLSFPRLFYRCPCRPSSLGSYPQRPPPGLAEDFRLPIQVALHGGSSGEHDCPAPAVV